MWFISLLCIIESYIILIKDKVTHLLKYKQEVLVPSMRRRRVQCKLGFPSIKGKESPLYFWMATSEGIVY